MGPLEALPWFFLPVVLWSMVWKGLALWRAGKNNSRWWFIAMFVVNTGGILEIVYIFVFSGRKARPAAPPAQPA